MRRYGWARAACGLAVRVGADGAPARVQLSSAAAEIPAGELARRILDLHSVATARMVVQQSPAGPLTASVVDALADMLIDY